jgi:hypothetical protein
LQNPDGKIIYEEIKAQYVQQYWTDILSNTKS